MSKAVSSRAQTDLIQDKIILKMKDEGKSLRAIVATLSISHEAVRKRLKNLANIEKLSTKEKNQELTVAAIEEEKVSNGSNADKSRASGKIKDTVNQVSTQETPSLSPTTGVNPFKTLSLKATEGKKGVSQDVLSEVDSLAEEIKQFLESKGIEIYRMQVSQ